jgi:hypothetical protein
MATVAGKGCFSIPMFNHQPSNTRTPSKMVSQLKSNDKRMIRDVMLPVAVSVCCKLNFIMTLEV